MTHNFKLKSQHDDHNFIHELCSSSIFSLRYMFYAVCHHFIKQYIMYVCLLLRNTHVCLHITEKCCQRRSQDLEVGARGIGLSHHYPPSPSLPNLPSPYPLTLPYPPFPLPFIHFSTPYPPLPLSPISLSFFPLPPRPSH